MELFDIEFAELLIPISPAIARLNNFDDRNLCNNFNNNSPICHFLGIYYNNCNKWMIRTYHRIHHNNNWRLRITIICIKPKVQKMLQETIADL